MAQASKFQVLVDVGELAIGLVGLFIAGWSLHLNRVRARTERTATVEIGKPTPCPQSAVLQSEIIILSCDDLFIYLFVLHGSTFGDAGSQSDGH